MTDRRMAGWVLEIATMCLLGFLALSLIGCTLLGCTGNGKPNEEQIRQKSAEATRQAQIDAKKLAASAKVAAGNAVAGANAVAQGVKDGMNSGKPGETGRLVDMNSASTARIAMLQGISVSKAQEIVKGRPYSDPHALVERGILTEKQYDRISNQITAK